MEGELVHFGTLQVVWAGPSIERSVCVVFLILVLMCFKTFPRNGRRETVLKTLQGRNDFTIKVVLTVYIVF